MLSEDVDISNIVGGIIELGSDHLFYQVFHIHDRRFIGLVRQIDGSPRALVFYITRLRWYLDESLGIKFRILACGSEIDYTYSRIWSDPEPGHVRTYMRCSLCRKILDYIPQY